MNFKEINKTMMYDEFGNKDYEGYLLIILMIGYATFMMIGGLGWLLYLSHFL